MRKVARDVLMFVAMATAIGFFGNSLSAQLYGPGDPVIAVDLDGNSSFPPGETPFNAVDQDFMTKYLNFGGRNTGLIVIPNSGPSVVQSIQFTTANDEPGRDPTSYMLFGSNDPVEEVDNGFSDEMDWTFISASPIVLPDVRFADSEIVDFANVDSFTSYRIIIDDIKDQTNPFAIMQFADVQLFTAPAGGGDPVLSGGDFALAITGSIDTFSMYPFAEVPTNVVDGTLNKYLNFGFLNSGFIIRRSDGAPVVIDGFTITTANDSFERDPASYQLFGTNDPITSQQNSDGENENWTLIDTADITLPDERNTEGDPVVVNNTAAFTAYRVIFPTSRAAANSIQIAEMTFTGEISDIMLGDVNCDGVIDLLDVAPFVDAITGAFNPKADINQDGVVDLLDVTPFIELLTG